MSAVVFLLAVVAAAMYLRRKLHRSKTGHLANVAAMRPLSEFDARFPRSRPRQSGRFMR